MKRRPRRPRNWLAVHAHFRKGAGIHGARKSRGQARGDVDLEEWLDEIEDLEEKSDDDYCSSSDSVVE